LKRNSKGSIGGYLGTPPELPAEVRRLLDAGAHFYHSMSGGKDSLR
jgi:hypothetical protein